MTRSSRWAMPLSQVWLAVAVLLPVLILQTSLGTIDLAYHLRAGQIMLRTHAILRTDSFSFVTAGHAWLNQQWGAQVVLAGVYDLLGWAGLALLHGVLVGLTFALIFLACRAAGAGAMLSSLLTLSAFAVSGASLPLRPQVLAAALFALTLWIVFSRRRRPGLMWFVPAITAAWANLHGTFFLGPLVLGLAWIEDAAEDSPTARRTLLITFTSVAATLVNPFGLRVWSYVLSLSTSPVIAKLISEWQPPSIRELSGALFFLSVAGVAVSLVRRDRVTPWTSLLWFGVFFAIALTATRSTAWWGLAAAPMLARLFRDSRSSQRRDPPPSPAHTLIAIALVLLVGVGFPWSFVGSSVQDPSPRLVDAPARMTTALAQALQPGDRIFAPQALGSWFEFALPRNPVFVDSRIELLPPWVWREDGYVFTGRVGWQRFLDRWNVRAVVIAEPAEAPLFPLIERDPGWRLLYSGTDGAAFIRA